MRVLLVLVLLLALNTLSCARKKASLPSTTSAKPANVGSTPREESLSLAPQSLLTGKVVKVNQTARFVVVNFPLGRMPAPGQEMSVYRAGLKQGEIRVTGPQLDDNIVGDVTAGDVKVGDEIRVK